MKHWHPQSEAQERWAEYWLELDARERAERVEQALAAWRPVSRRLNHLLSSTTIIAAGLLFAVMIFRIAFTAPESASAASPLAARSVTPSGVEAAGREGEGVR
jgi:hypothetical protein